MNRRRPYPIAGGSSGCLGAQESGSLSNRILDYASLGLSTMDFLHEVSKLLLDYTGCNAIEMRVVERAKLLNCEASLDFKQGSRVEVVPSKRSDVGKIIPCLEADSDLEKVCEEIACSRFDPSLPIYTANGSFWIGDTKNPLDLSSETCKWAGGRTLYIKGDFRSLAIIPFVVQDEDRGLLLLKSYRQDYFTTEDIESYEDLARILGIALTQLRAQVALRERVKELTCLYGIAKVAAKPGISLEEILQGAAELLPPGWLHPDVALARIVFDGSSFTTPGFRENLQTQSAEIVIDGAKRGTIEVAYAKQMPELDEGPFLKEERNLIDAIAGEVALIIRNRQVEEEKEKLQMQLRHADRLATLGQLAAGIAHELNEPLASIVGFAQLANKVPGVPRQVQKDNEKIVAASLHAREVINKLKLFARQAPTHRERVNLNDIVQGGLYLVESRCTKAGIELVRVLEPDMSEIIGDSGQLYQVLVNLVVNAMQAMPDGGRITIRTTRQDANVVLCIEDNGMGMDDEVLKNIFAPFFTTKDVDKGTGLGLAVVHGIVNSHGGSITVNSAVGQGTRFEVLFPIDKSDELKEPGTGEQDGG